MRFLPVGILLAAACTTQVTDQSRTVIARVGTAELTLEEARADIPRDAYSVDSSFALASYRDRWIREQVWLEEAKARSFAGDPAIQFKARRAADETVTHLYRRTFMEEAAGSDVSDAEIRAFYEKNRKEFAPQEPFVRVLHFRAIDLKTALEAKSRLSKGIDPEDVVNELGLDKQQTLLESNRPVPQSRAMEHNPILRQYLNELIEIREISPIKRIGEQFHFVQLLEKTKAGEFSESDENYARIREWLTVEKKRLRLEEKENELYRRAKASGTIQTFILPESKSDR